MLWPFRHVQQKGAHLDLLNFSGNLSFAMEIESLKESTTFFFLKVAIPLFHQIINNLLTLFFFFITFYAYCRCGGGNHIANQA